MADQANGTTDLYFNIDGVGSWNATIPHNIAALGGRQATDLLELAVARAGEYFIKGYMKLRFNPSYARINLGYKITPGTQANKTRRARKFADAANPNVWTGTTKNLALTTSRVETRAKGGRTKMTIVGNIRQSRPGYVNANGVTGPVLDKITKDEGRRMADVFFKEVAAMASRFTITSTTTRKGVVKTRTSASTQDSVEFGRTSRASAIVKRSAVGEA